MSVTHMLLTAGPAGGVGPLLCCYLACGTLSCSPVSGLCLQPDLNVALAVVLPPGSSAAGTTVNDTVNVQQVAATALSLLGLPLSSLTAGAANPLPGLGTSPASAAAPTAATLPLASSTASGAAAAAALAPAAPAAVSSAGAVVAPAGANQANAATPAQPKPEAAG